MSNLILASKSKVRKEILNKNNISCIVEPSNVDEDTVKESLLNEGANPEIISGDAFCLINDFLTLSSSTFEGITSQLIPFKSNISLLTLLLEAKIILTILVFYLKNFYY